MACKVLAVVRVLPPSAAGRQRGECDRHAAPDRLVGQSLAGRAELARAGRAERPGLDRLFEEQEPAHPDLGTT